MNQLEYLKLLKLVKTAIEEYKNWGEEELVVDKFMQNINMEQHKTKINVENSKFENMCKKENVKPKKFEKECKEAKIFCQDLPDNNELKNIKKEEIKNKEQEDIVFMSENIQTKNAEQKLENLKKQIVNCKKCDLGKYRLNAVCGSGDAYADIMFVGEGPGFWEDHKGQPFIGRAGDLLTKIIVAMGFTRETVYIVNIVKCHPMKNPQDPEAKGNDRPPTQEEMQICQHYLDEQIKIIQPKVIVTLGASSTRALLKTDDVISSLRGKFTSYLGIPLMPTYHPAALLRNPKLKKDVWIDMQKVIATVKKKG